MNLHIINEAFKRRYSDVLTESVDESYKGQLKKALVMRSMNVVSNGGNKKDLEIALQGVIEEFFPDKSWWEVTDCNIFMELLGGANPREVCDMIVDQLKDGCCEESLTEAPDADGILYDYEVGAKYNDLANAEMKQNAKYRSELKELKDRVSAEIVPRVCRLLDMMKNSDKNAIEVYVPSSTSFISRSAVLNKTKNNFWFSQRERGEWSKNFSVTVGCNGDIDIWCDSGSWTSDVMRNPGSGKTYALRVFLENFDEAESKLLAQLTPSKDDIDASDWSRKYEGARAIFHVKDIDWDEDTDLMNKLDGEVCIIKWLSVDNDNFSDSYWEIDFEDGTHLDAIGGYCLDVLDTPKNESLIKDRERAPVREAVSNPERTISKVDKNLAKEVDKDLVRDLTLCIENDGEVYRRSITPVIKNLKRKRANGQFDEKLAIQAFFHVVEGALKMPHFYRYYTYSIQTVSVPERYAVAKELLDGAMDEIEFEDMNENLSTAKLKRK